MGVFQSFPMLINQFGVLVLTCVGWGYWVWLGCRVYDRTGRFNWLWSGFTGFAANALFLQALVYVDLPLSHSAWYGFIVAGGGVAALGWRWVNGEWRPSCRTRRELWLILAVGTAAAVLQGWAVWRIGPADYYGRGRYDLTTYVEMAQFLSDEPYSLEAENIGLQPWAAKGVAMKQTRLTQSVVQGYLAVVSRTDSQHAYGALSVFYAVLPALCSLGLLRLLSLGRWAAGLGALWTAWLPATSYIHLENFFSQNTVLFVFPALAAVWLEARRPSRLAVACSAVLMAFLYGAYTEYFLLGWASLFFVLLTASGPSLRQKMFWYTAIILGSLLLNPYYSFISVEYMREQMEHVTNPAFLSELAVESGTWRGLIRNFFDFDWLSQTGSAVIAGAMALLGCFGLIAGNRSRRFVAGISLAPLAAIMAMLAARELHKYPFAKLIASFAPVAAILVTLGVHHLCARFFWPGFRRARLATAGVLGVLAVVSAVGTWRQQQEVVGNGYFLPKINTESMHAARRFMALNPALTYVIGGRDPLAVAWLCYYARASDVYVLNNAVGDIGLYSEMFWCRRVPAGLRSFVYVGDRGVISVGPVIPSPSVAVVDPQWIANQGSNYTYGSNLPMKMEIDRRGQSPASVRMLLEFTVTCGPAFSGPSVLRWGAGRRTGEIAFSGQISATIPLDLQPGGNGCTIAVYSSQTGRPVSYFIQQIDLSGVP